ncbi:MAG: hypothetical protein B6229_00905 [Spirochaetaceae bacterium 4572_7]|nr:MAG: hypothetical protein B6229_00905 [Spirochaetaceae bacterium 4572_7]
MKVLTLIVTLSLLLSCSSKHYIHIHENNSSSINFTISNSDSLIRTLSEWGSIQELKNGIIDLNEVKKELLLDENISNVEVISNNDTLYSGKFSTSDITTLFQGSTRNLPNDAKIFSIEKNEDLKTLTISLSIDNYKYLKKSLPILQEESLEMLGPDANRDISIVEYLDMMSFTLGDDGVKDIESSNVKLYITVDGSITNVEGGKKIGDNQALFSIPLLDIILLKKGIKLLISYT